VLLEHRSAGADEGDLRCGEVAFDGDEGEDEQYLDADRVHEV